MRIFVRLPLLVALALSITCAAAVAQEVRDAQDPISAATINAADVSTLAANNGALDRPYIFPPETAVVDPDSTVKPPALPNPAIVRLQVLLDQHGASPGVIDGYDGENVRKAVMGLQAMAAMPVTGTIDDALLAQLEDGQPVIGDYVIVADDTAEITGPTPPDYADKAQLDFLGYTSVAEALAERFHMDINLLTVLNPDADFVAGETIAVAMTGTDRSGQVMRIEADKSLRQVRAYDAQGQLLAAYPATIGSEDNPSPSGSYVVTAVAPMPNYTYNPAINFQQGQNTNVLTIPPGPNGPVGSMWIALSKPTYGIHGTPEPSQIDKTGSHGCVRLTNWDAAELAGMVAPGVMVDFI